jgi:hypothetical protein
LGFGAAELTIDLEIHVDGTSLTLLGLLTPPTIARIEIQTTDGATVATAESDISGRFRTQLAAEGEIRFRVWPDDPGSASLVETSWITI